MKKARIGIIGCGNISPQYLKNLTERFPFCVEVAACTDLIGERAARRADEFHIPKVCRSNEELLADPEIELVVNLTNPWAHYEVSLAALEAGKHIYTEKPLAGTRAEGRRLLEAASARGVRLGGAPDTFLGGGLQTCRKLIDDGWVGRPMAATAFLAVGIRGPQYHRRTVGPLLDMAPYYVTALVAMLGPVRCATGSAWMPHAEKTCTDPLAAEYGQSYRVEVPTVVAGVLDFACGVVATLLITNESFHYTLRLEVFGTEGTLTCGDPNMFGGPILIERRNQERRELPLSHGYPEKSLRGLGVAEMVHAIRNARPHRASGELVYHALDVMEAITDASRDGRHVEIESTLDRPAPFEPGLLPNVLD